MLASSTKYLIIGAGIHGLSTSYHLALELKKRGLGSGKDIIVIDKSGIGAGASGIASMGKVMGLASAQIGGQAEGKTISGIVKKLLV